MPELLRMGSALVAEGRFRSFGFIEAKARAMFESLIDGPGVVFVNERVGQIVGGMACGLSGDWFSDIPLTFDYGVFVWPEHRGTFAGFALMKAYVNWARAQAPVVNINIGVTSGIDEERTVALYGLLGLKRIGSALSNLG
ncbi:GNAT family N-acetyltransferase [Paraburkholderia sp. D1E]|uniref:GNAT family N-acetyltransferase n=1 Tax=Paraburkholderia sp. D1E TaxID=3461398 RepID=UPI0040457B99